jgi:hypothetical protein
MVTNGKVRVVRFFSKALVTAQLNWSVIKKECYGIFYGVRLFENLLDNRPFILKTDHKNLTYLNVTLTGKESQICYQGFVTTTCLLCKNQERRYRRSRRSQTNLIPTWVIGSMP